MSRGTFCYEAEELRLSKPQESIRLDRTMKLSIVRIFCVLGFVAAGGLAQDVIPLYPGAAPGPVEGSYQEKEYFSKIWNTEVVTNVTTPTLTMYKPAAGTSNGNAVVICPGG